MRVADSDSAHSHAQPPPSLVPAVIHGSRQRDLSRLRTRGGPTDAGVGIAHCKGFAVIQINVALCTLLTSTSREQWMPSIEESDADYDGADLVIQSDQETKAVCACIHRRHARLLPIVKGKSPHE